MISLQSAFNHIRLTPDHAIFYMFLSCESQVSSEQQADLSFLSEVFRRLDADCDG